MSDLRELVRELAIELRQAERDEEVITLSWIANKLESLAASPGTQGVEEKLQTLLARADMEYMNDDTPKSDFAEQLLDALFELVPFERSKG